MKTQKYPFDKLRILSQPKDTSSYKNNKFPLLFSSFAICLTLYFSLPTLQFTPPIYADGTSIEVSPSVLKIQAKPPTDVWAPFIIKNQSDQQVELTIGYKAIDPQASQNGAVVFLKNGEPVSGQDKKIFQKMQIVDNNNTSQNTLLLGPKQSTRLRLHIILPANEPSSDYYFSLIFLQNTSEINQNITNKNNSDQSSISILQTGIALNVLLAVGDQENAQGTINTFSTPFLREAGPVPFDLTVFNSGAHFISPHGQILVKNMFGQAIGKITIPSTTILAGTGRTLTNNVFANPSLYGSSNASLQNSTTLIWPENFLLGRYTATLSLTLSSNGPTYTRTIQFFALPVNYLLNISIGLVILLLIYLRLKKKMS